MSNYNQKKKKYYNNEYLETIRELANDYKLNRAIKEYQTYLRNYPNEIVAYIYYADALIKINRLEEAEEMLNIAETMRTSRNSHLSLNDVLQAKLKLLCCQKKYAEAYALLQENEAFLVGKSFPVNYLKIFLKSKLGILEESDYQEQNGYAIQQLLKYDEQNAINHIKSHHGFTSDMDLRFAKEFPIEEMYYQMRAMLPHEERLNSNGIKNYYNYRYNSCGYFHDNLVNYFQVVTFADSNDIITMYPFENKEKNFYTDLSPVPEESMKLDRVRRQSQIDKFNQRYGNIGNKK